MIAIPPPADTLPRRIDLLEPASTNGAQFGALLKHYRTAAGLSQEALAQRAGLSIGAVSALERGNRRAPYRGTVLALADALGLAGPELAALEAAVSRFRGPRPAASPSQAAAPHPAPLPPTPLLGRDEELATAQELLRSEGVRLVTLTGPGGVGKTRLALSVAREVQAAFPHGVWLVDLAPIRDPALVLRAIAETFEIQERTSQALLATLQAFLGERQLLLVLDNFEQVLDAAPQLAELLAASPGLKLLVTSRTRLRLRWEHALPLLPLAVPDPELPPTVEALAAVPSVALFVERTQASNPAFALTPDNASAVAALCRHLEGLPLALELAAARANVLAPAEMLAWAESRLPVLGWDAPDLPARQQSLRAAIAWSYALLPAADQALFRRLAVFAGGWTLDAVELVTQTSALGVDPLEGLTRLIDASLVQRSHDGDGGPRFTLLETLREFAWEQLEASGERESAQRRHAAYFEALAERADPALRGAEQVESYCQLQREEDNLRAALEWAAEQGEVAVELRLAGRLAYYWWESGRPSEGRGWLEHALARAGDLDDCLRYRALAGVGLLAAFLGDSAGAADRLESAFDLARERGDAPGIVGVLGKQAFAAWLEGRHDRAPALASALAAARPRADPWSVAYALFGLGLIAHEAGTQDVATAYLEEALALFRRVGERRRAVSVLIALAAVALAQGDFARAAALVTEALQLGRVLRAPRPLSWGADVAVQVNAERGPSLVLARHLGAVDALRATVGFARSPHQRQWHDRIVARTRGALGEEAFSEAWASGRTMALEPLIAELLTALEPRPVGEPGQPAAPRQPRADGLLSPREREVLPLVAVGLTNKEIAERLVISESTARYHVGSLLQKLGADNRTQAVAHAQQQGLL